MRAGDVRPKGECAWCGDDFALRDDGTVRRHRDIGGDTWFCPGGLRVPASTSRSAAPSPAWLTEHTAVVAEAMCREQHPDLHPLVPNETYRLAACFKCEEAAPAITAALAAEAEKGGAS